MDVLVKPRPVSAQKPHERSGDDPVRQTSRTHADPNKRLEALNEQNIAGASENAPLFYEVALRGL